MLIALFISANIPKKEGVLNLDRNVSSYSNDELRELAKKEFSSNGNTSVTLSNLQNRGVAFQTLLWVFGVFAFRRAGNKYLLYSALMLAFMSGVELFSLFQVLLIFSCTVAAHFILRLRAMKATSTH